VNALQAARKRFPIGPQYLFRAFVRSSERMAVPQLAQQFREWGEAGLVQDLPRDYESTQSESEVPAVICDAVKVRLSFVSIVELRW
jgi:hypothetical protein